MGKKDRDVKSSVKKLTQESNALSGFGAEHIFSYLRNSSNLIIWFPTTEQIRHRKQKVRRGRGCEFQLREATPNPEALAGNDQEEAEKSQ